MLKSHEHDVKEMNEEREKERLTYGGPIALVSKRKVVKEIDCNVEEKDDGKFNVEDDDVLAY